MDNSYWNDKSMNKLTKSMLEDEEERKQLFELEQRIAKLKSTIRSNGKQIASLNEKLCQCKKLSKRQRAEINALIKVLKEYVPFVEICKLLDSVQDENEFRAKVKKIWMNKDV